jgi:N4-(beta-N-acetylglucosaminyl)-L-asparaginase
MNVRDGGIRDNIDSSEKNLYFHFIAYPPEDFMPPTRREFLRQASLVGAGTVVAASLPVSTLERAAAQAAPQPIVIASGNGLRSVTKAMEMIRSGSDALDAVIAGVNIVEDDPNDHTVGYGGLPNEDGVVELDSAVMHGPTHRAGAVASLRNIRNPSKVARVVMERTDHVLLVGDGALRFAKAHGFKEENLLTDEAREIWLRWRETMSGKDDWLPPHTENDKEVGEAGFVRPDLRGGESGFANEYAPDFRSTGTIHCSAIDMKGNISCVTTTSGLAYKMAGRVGDSPIIGAGLFVDNDIGAAGSTGRGEANLINCSSVMIVEYMRQGKSPEQACLDACQRIVDHNRMRRLKDDGGRPTFDVKFYAVNKKGTVGSAGIYGGGQFALHDNAGPRLVPMAYLYKKVEGK